MAGQEHQLKVELPKALQAGVYANLAVITHTKEEFILDFAMVTPAGGTVTSRVVCSPGHMKRLLAAIEENLQRYERAHGAIAAADAPRGPVGFSVQ